MNGTTSRDVPTGFATTRWSTITQVFGPGSRDPAIALGELCMRYRYPVYAYVRRCGHSPAAALDIARSFLGHLRRHFRGDGQPPSREHFRRYLLTRLHAYLAADWRSTPDDGGDDADYRGAELEQRYLDGGARDASPEEAFQRGFALEVLNRSLARLREEALQTGHGDMYDALVGYLVRDPGPGEYDELARRLRKRPLAVVIALKRLRQRLRELSSEELADTVASADELIVEQRALFAILQGKG